MSKKFTVAAVKNDIKTIQQLVDFVDIEFKDENGHAALMLAADYGHTEILELLIQKGAKLENEYRYGKQTALFYAIANRHIDSALTLIKYGANVNHSDSSYDTPLIIASFNGNEEMVNLLLKKGSDVNLRNENEDTALMCAVCQSYHRIVESIMAYNADIGGAFELAEENHDYISMALLKEDINQPDENGDTLLIKACKRKDEKSVLFLVEMAGSDCLFIENNNGDSAYKILDRKQSLPAGLQALKEKLVLEKFINEVNVSSPSL